MFNASNTNLDLTKPLLLAHRGSSLLAPENTNIAFDLALSHGSDVLEIDVRLSRDNEVIVTHDATVDRTSNGTGLVARLSLSELKALDAGFRFVDLNNKPYQGQGAQFITLNELFEHYPDTNINIDIKDNSEEAAKRVADILIKINEIHRVNVGSFHASVMHAFRRFAPMISTAATQKEVAKLYAQSWFSKTHSVTKLTPSANPVAFNALQIPRNYRGIPLATKRFIAYTQSRQIPAMYWTINDPTVMKKLLGAGAAGIVTDRTDLAAAVFKEHRNRHGTKSGT